MKEGDSGIYYMFKYGIVIFGDLFVVVPLMLQFGDNVTVNGVPGKPDIWETISLGLIGILIILFGILFFPKFVIVQMNNEVLRIWKGEHKSEVSWLEVESITQLPIVSPPLYKLRLKNYGNYFLFNTSRWGVSFLFFSFYWSDMGTLIKKIKPRLNI